MELTDRQWRKFVVGDLFRLESGKCSRANQLVKDSNGLPYLGATNRNNAVLDFVKRDEALMQRGNCIAFIKDGEGSMGYAVYKREDFIATTNIAVGYADFLNEYTGIFITTVSAMVRGKYSFNYKRNEERLRQEIIQLPVDEAGNPDWAFIEAYMREREQKTLREYIAYVKSRLQPAESLTLEGKKWGEFILGNLFDVVLPSGDTQADKCRDGKFPLLSAGSNNNGICKFIEYGDKQSQRYDCNVISVDMFGKAFFHGYIFYSVSHGRINLLRPRLALNKWQLQFMIKAIDASTKGKFSYNQMCSSKRVKSLIIMLPIDDRGRPDWEFMTQYMQASEYRLYLQYLEAKLQGGSDQ